MTTLSPWAKSVCGHYPIKAFRCIGDGICPRDEDISAFVRSYILEGVPKAFVRLPIAFDKIRCIISGRLGVLPSNVCLTGSAKLGFSLSPSHWLRKYNCEKSDLDFFIVSDLLFARLSSELSQWELDYGNAVLKPSSDFERSCWINNMERLKGNITRGFLNPGHISTHYPWARKCKKLCDQLPGFARSLSGTDAFSTYKFTSSFRVYSSVDSAIRQIKLNIKTAISRAAT